MTVSTTWPVPPPPFPEYDSEGWLLDEDRALRDLMKGMIVTDGANQQRPVEAWFGHPDQELREQKYPYITVDLLSINEGKDRVHRGDWYYKDPPPWWGLATIPDGTSAVYHSEMPHPIDLDYQISTWARNPRHDRQMLQQLIMGGRLMIRSGLLACADNNYRRIDYLSHAKRTYEESGKRVFSNMFRVRVSSEVPWGVFNVTPGTGTGTPPTNVGGPYIAYNVNYLSHSMSNSHWEIDGEAITIVTDELLTGVVAAVNSDSTVDVTVDNDGSTLSSIPVERVLRYFVGTGDKVVVHRRGNQSLVIAGE